jgi:hypothetical protein
MLDPGLMTGSLAGVLFLATAPQHIPSWMPLPYGEQPGRPICGGHTRNSLLRRYIPLLSWAESIPSAGLNTNSMR